MLLNRCAHIVVVGIYLDQKFDTLGKTPPSYSPHGLIKEHLQVWRVTAVVTLHIVLYSAPHTLHTIGSLVFASAISLLSLVHYPMLVIVLQAIVTTPEVSPHFSSQLNIFQNYLSQRLLGSIFHMYCALLLAASFIKAKDPHFGPILALGSKNALINFNSSPKSA
jgi:hypothetical protein